MTTDPQDDRKVAGHRRAEAVVTTTAPSPALQALDLDGLAPVGLVCAIDDPDCNPMPFAGTNGAPASPVAISGGRDEATS